MAEATHVQRENALAFLDELDEKHDRLLTELDVLSGRIDTILNQYAVSRQSASSDAQSGQNSPLVNTDQPSESKKLD